MQGGIYLFHKGAGPTSFSLVREVLDSAKARSDGKVPKICHGGALDPFASGLLLILVEPATRLFDYLHPIPKTYQATVRWGVETDNGDPLGKVIFEGDASKLDPATLEDTLARMIGWHEQVPHATSNKRIAGERAYRKAHRGEEVVLPPTSVYLHSARWLRHDLPKESRLEITVRGGYYVRALARDLGRTLGCGAHLSQLHRSSIGPWEDAPNPPPLIRGSQIMSWAPLRILTDFEVGELRSDRPIPRGEILPGDWTLPEGFPDPQAPIRGFHLEKFCFLLKKGEYGLSVLTPLRGGL